MRGRSPAGARMHGTLPTLPLSTRRVYTSSSLAAAGAHFSRFVWPHRVRPLGRIPGVRFVHNQASIGGIGVNALHYGAPLEVSSAPAGDTYLLLVFLAGSGDCLQGNTRLPLGVEHTVVVNPDRHLHLRLSAEQYNLTLSIPGWMVRECATQMTGRPLRGAVEFAGAVPAAGLRRLLGGVCAELDSRESVLGRTVAGCALADALGRALVSCMLAEVPNNAGGDGPPALATLAASRHVMRAEEYIRAHLRHPITLKAIATASGVSARALQVGFRRSHGLSPMQFLRERRLDLARAALQRPGPDAVSVTQIAYDSGFTHMAKFARLYRLRFGEPPSQTLKRSRHANQRQA